MNAVSNWSFPASTRSGGMNTSCHALVLAALLAVAGPCAAQGKLVMGGAGSMAPVMQELAKAYEAKHGPQGIEVLTNSLGSGGGIKATESGRLSIGLTGRELKEGEKGVLVYRLLATAPVTVAVNPDVPLGSITAAQLCDIYTGATRSWKQLGGPDLPIVALTRNEDDTDKASLREHVGCYKGWKESAEVVVLTSATGMAAALGSRPGTIGLLNHGSVLKSQGRVKALALEGVAPNQETVASGKYRLVKNFAVVTKGEPQGLVKSFLEFVAGSEGQRILASNGLVPRR